ncbi:MAG TPA: hypothetical protein PK018_18265 [Candidatus Competibacter sp.]|nr:hypothetical protein [Candidatus Competibacteraceae bacterium]HPE74089.1 hypothetical protein [Candidatus Competibacter sp.]
MPLLSNDYLKQFFAFLENATEAELRERHDALWHLAQQTPDREFKKTLRWLMSKVDEELLTRLTLKQS